MRRSIIDNKKIIRDMVLSLSRRASSLPETHRRTFTRNNPIYVIECNTGSAPLRLMHKQSAYRSGSCNKGALAWFETRSFYCIPSYGEWFDTCANLNWNSYTLVLASHPGVALTGNVLRQDMQKPDIDCNVLG